MKKAEVKVGGTYAAKVSGKVVTVRIDAENPRGGWGATNTITGKKVRIKSAQRLRGAVHKSKPMALAIPSQAGGKRPQGAKKPKGETKAKKERKDATRAKRGGQGAKRASCLDAAATVLAEAKEPMSCGDMVTAMLDRGLWQTKGRTPASTIYAAIIRDVAKRGQSRRFRKVARGKFGDA